MRVIDKTKFTRIDQFVYVFSYDFDAAATRRPVNNDFGRLIVHRNWYFSLFGGGHLILFDAHFRADLVAGEEDDDDDDSITQTTFKFHETLKNGECPSP